jgi:hypothetical protein
MEQLHGGLKDIFSTILRNHHEQEGSRQLPPIIVLHGNGNVIAPGGTVHVVSRGHPSDALMSGAPLVPANESPLGGTV